MTTRLQLSKIVTDGGTQSREGLDQRVIEEYAEAYTAKAPFPPVVVFHDGERYWLSRGFHRCAAAAKAGRATIDAEVRKGGQREAILFGVGDNAEHGLRRTPEDKRHAVKLLLADPEWAQKSDRWIAEQCRVGNKFVGDIRREMSSAPAVSEHTSTPKSASSRPARVKGKDGKMYATRKRAAKDAEPEGEGPPTWPDVEAEDDPISREMIILSRVSGYLSIANRIWPDGRSRDPLIARIRSVANFIEKRTKEVPA